MIVLNIGGNNKRIPLPARYTGWEHLILDVTNEADYNYDLLDYIAGKSYYINPPKCDAVYMSHMLEHFAPATIVPVLEFIRKEFLLPNGTLELKVPNVKEVMVHVIHNNMSLIDPLYELAGGDTINTIDILYGCQKRIKQGNEYMTHRMAFDKPTLEAVLYLAGFDKVEWLQSDLYFELNCLCQSSTQTPSNLNG